MALSKFRAEIYKNAAKIGVKTLNSFQQKSIPTLMNKKNSILLSEPGTGKSISYLIAIAQLVSLDSYRSPSPTSQDTSLDLLFTKPAKMNTSSPHGAIILVPTQELSLQIYRYLRILAPWLNIIRTNNSLPEISATIQHIKEDNYYEESIKNQGFYNLAIGKE